MTDNPKTGHPPTIPVVPPRSWLQPHAEHLGASLRERGHDQASAISTLAAALIEEATMFITAYTRRLADPAYTRRLAAPARVLVAGDADMSLALAGVTISAYAVADQLHVMLDDWCGLKLRHLEDDRDPGLGKR